MQPGRLKKLIMPLIFEQILAISVGFADTFMVSCVGEAAVAGVDWYGRGISYLFRFRSRKWIDKKIV